ncbi:hypothetical protein VW23_001855 [Devosia insulae DS-56]|uniref:Methyltransferase small domain-containing protein n=1 Tax=Devosia insulae DS-56 TaxID=1116389 RepID=A0A1E5XM29_9HYPH|nr:methyltransferase [Devosia insulae]OEO29660.1 hypothetical protein VW23_001855 [Devosia insulae DS-56]
MSQGVLDVITLPFRQGLLAVDEGFLIRGDFSPSLEATFGRSLVAEQTYQPAFERLRQAGIRTTAQLEGRHSLGLCVLTQHKLETFANIARAYSHLSNGGVLVCAGQNSLGAATYEKAVAKLAPLLGSLSKAKCRIFWLARAEEDLDAWSPWLSYATPRPIANTPFVAVPGTFSWDRVDAGSEFLVAHLPPGIAGVVGDLGAGWGFLSWSLLTRYPAIRQLDLFEAEKLALDMARANLAPLGDTRQIRYHWSDVRDGVGRGSYDWIVTNPPFHREGIQDVELGATFLNVAAAALRSGGKLVFVANRHLPYERTLKASFKTVSVLAENGTFKVLLATK